MSLLNILQLEINLFLAAVVVLVLLPFSSNHKVRYYGCFAVYAVFTSTVALLLMPVFLIRITDPRNIVYAAEILKHTSKLIGVQWELRGGDILAVERGAVVVANHQSMLDIQGAYSFWKLMGRCTMVAKKELFYVWPFGLGAWMAGVVFIDRNRGRVANSQLDDASRLVTKKKTKLWIFPEGTRKRTSDNLLPFKKGAFRIAVACQAPIIPVVYSPYYFMDSKKKYFGHGRVIIQCLEPVSTEGKTESDIDSIIAEIRGKMEKQYELLKQEVLYSEDNSKLIH